MVSVRINGDPRPKGSLICRGPRKCRKCGTGIIHPVTEDSTTAKEWRGKIESAGRELFRRAGGTIDAPVKVVATFLLARPKSAATRTYPHLPPDVDKLARMLLDAFTSAAVIRDDALVVDLYVTKRYADDGKPGVFVTIEPLTATATALPI